MKSRITTSKTPKIRLEISVTRLFEPDRIGQLHIRLASITWLISQAAGTEIVVIKSAEYVTCTIGTRDRRAHKIRSNDNDVGHVVHAAVAILNARWSKVRLGITPISVHSAELALSTAETTSLSALRS